MIYQFPDVYVADYILLDRTLPTWPLRPERYRAQIEARLATGHFIIKDAADGYLLLERQQVNTMNQRKQ